MGYFELPNLWNNHSAGLVLDIAPKDNGHNTVLQTQDITSPGPLVTSILAVFGNGSFFNTIASANDSEVGYQVLCRNFANLSRESLRFPYQMEAWASGPRIQPG